ncbi:MAG: hypothetical protein P1V20_30445, partial [Verrucomicrobiales bacterium]|nr:hypothetical protein [Verrucomicrobiales bacterium]
PETSALRNDRHPRSQAAGALCRKRSRIAVAAGIIQITGRSYRLQRNEAGLSTTPEKVTHNVSEESGE